MMFDGMEIDRKVIPLFHKIWNDHHNAQHFAFYLEYMTFHMYPPRLKPALEWMIANKLTGQKFLDFVSNDCRNSPLELIRYLTMALEKEKKMRTLYAYTDVM